MCIELIAYMYSQILVKYRILCHYSSVFHISIDNLRLFDYNFNIPTRMRGGYLGQTAAAHALFPRGTQAKNSRNAE